ncbi:hypothetical protein IQ264_23765 [Phormidium sp. LEGE 05292]|uniref:hypothetical protein n=1 Tax=[Phormidium] sp. LEGE 05292 TaxID=767427 RepID=UPI00188302F4|nr:hypothetical protein [Phormidium sp. LEGE 05292]MBE9228440.1 hypothetical protein [Phormidium sp. LEGE 05292]
MNDFAIVFATNEKFLSQALFMYEQLRTYGLEQYAWVVPLENLQIEHLDSLHKYFGDRVTDTLHLPKKVKLSANKIFLPKMVPVMNRYVLIDTDIVIIDRGFINTFLNYPEERVVLVGESFTWKEWLSFDSPSKLKMVLQLPHLLEQAYVQTGSIGISRKVHENIFDAFVQELTSERTHKGDITIWNDWVGRIPDLFQIVEPHCCLVLRPDGSGPSSKLHISDLTYKNGILLYRNAPVMALHFTSSKGISRNWNDYQSLVATLKISQLDDA